MIELCVEPYCQDCLHFKAHSITSYLHADDGNFTVVSSVVKCENAETCEEIEKHIAYYFYKKGETNGQSD